MIHLFHCLASDSDFHSGLLIGPFLDGQTTSVCNQPPRPTQAPTLSGIGNECEPKCDDALLMGVKAGVAHSICGCKCGWQVKLCNLSLTCAICEHLKDEFTQHEVLYKVLS